MKTVPKMSKVSTWNQKNLDYEIETFETTDATFVRSDLKPKEPRLRDWNDSYRLDT